MSAWNTSARPWHVTTLPSNDSVGGPWPVPVGDVPGTLIGTVAFTQNGNGTLPSWALWSGNSLDGYASSSVPAAAQANALPAGCSAMVHYRPPGGEFSALPGSAHVVGGAVIDPASLATQAAWSLVEYALNNTALQQQFSDYLQNATQNGVAYLGEFALKMACGAVNVADQIHTTLNLSGLAPETPAPVPDAASSSGSQSTSALVGGVLGAVAGASLLLSSCAVATVACLARRRQQRRAQQNQTVASDVEMPSQYPTNPSMRIDTAPVVAQQGRPVCYPAP